MTTQQERKEQDDYSEDLDAAVLHEEDREIFIEAVTNNISSDGLEQLSGFIIELREEINQEPCGAQHVRNELNATLESLFQRSEAFRLAYELYASRFHIRSGNIQLSGKRADLAEMLREIKAATLDEEETPDPYGWMQKLGDAVAELYESLNEKSFYGLAHMITEFVTDHAYTNDHEARVLFPHGLRNALAHCEKPKLKVLFYTGQTEIVLAEIIEGDISENFKTLITGIEKVTPPTEAKHGEATLIVQLVRDDEKCFMLYREDVAREAIESLSDFIKQTFGVEAAELPAEEPKQAPAADESEDKTPPAWVPRLSAAIAEALEDERLSEKAEDLIATLLTELDNRYCEDFPTLAKTTLPVSLYRACGFEPPETEAPQAAPSQTSNTVLPVSDTKTVFNLCDYKKLSLSFRRRDDDDEAFSFDLIRNHRDTDEIYFNTEGPNSTAFNRGGYSFPLRGNHKGERREDITLSGNGEIEFLGYKDERAFLLTWRRVQGHFEAEFDLYDAKGNVVQVLEILE
jgi:hypothetical protein